MENFSKIVATIVQSLIYAKYKHWTIRRLGTHEALADYYGEIEPLVDFVSTFSGTFFFIFNITFVIASILNAVINSHMWLCFFCH